VLCLNWTDEQFFTHFILTKIHKTVPTRAALFGSHMHQIVFRLGLRPKLNWGAYSAPPDPLAVLGRRFAPVPDGKEEKEGKGKEKRGLRGRKGRGGVEEGKGRKKEGKKGRERRTSAA